MNVAGLYNFLIEPPRMHVGRPWMNYAGLQVVRALWTKLLFELRPGFFSEEVASELETISRDGHVVMPNFFSVEQFESIERAVELWTKSGNPRIEHNKDNTGVNWVHGAISDGDPGGRVIIDAVAKNPRILKIVSGVMRRRIKQLPRVAYQHLEVPQDEKDDKDRECILHADRMFPTVKAFLYLNDNTMENGAYVYCPGSHELSWARLKHEYEYSIREAKVRYGRATAISGGLMERGRNIVSLQSRRAMRLEEKSIVGNKNTLVISNNMAFHRRGTIQPGRARKQLRLIFHYLEEPLYAPLVTGLYKLGRTCTKRTHIYRF